MNGTGFVGGGGASRLDLWALDVVQLSSGSLFFPEGVFFFFAA